MYRCIICLGHEGVLMADFFEIPGHQKTIIARFLKFPGHEGDISSKKELTSVSQL